MKTWSIRCAARPSELMTGLYLVTMICGIIDAVCFLALGGVFAEVMTGNLMFMAFSLGTGHPVAEYQQFLFPVGAFVIGALLGGRLLKGRDQAKDERFGFVIEWVLLVAASLVALLTASDPNQLSGQFVVALLAIAMGLQNALIRIHGIPDLATNVMTLTLTGLVAESSLTGWDNHRWERRLFSISLFIASAAFGAFLLRFGTAVPLLVASGIFTLALYPLLRGIRPVS